MTLRPTPLVLTARALTAVITVWCLGCSAFDPMLDALVGWSRMGGMDCASEMSATATPKSIGQGATSVSSSPETAGHVGYPCDCGGCYAASPQSVAIAIATETLPSPEPHTVAQMLSVTRAPIAPPPESRTL